MAESKTKYFKAPKGTVLSNGKMKFVFSSEVMMVEDKEMAEFVASGARVEEVEAPKKVAKKEEEPKEEAKSAPKKK